MKVLHIITGLSTGGAEMMMYKIISCFKKMGHNSEVISLGVEGQIAELIRKFKIPLTSLGVARNKIPSPRSLLKLISIVRHSKSEIIQGWMYHGNLAAIFARIFQISKAPVIWNIRQSLYDIKKEKLLTQFIIRANSFFSSYCDVIIYNSHLSARQHEAFGFNKNRTVVIPNGFDTNLFKPNEIFKNQFKKDLNLSSDTFVIGLVGRYHPMKDHMNFINAACELIEKNDSLRFIMIGSGVDSTNLQLISKLKDLSVNDKFILLGERSDTAQITNCFDIAVSSSAWGEGFPNVIGEAMSCAVPCVVTDVGDSSYVVADTGFVVPPRNSHALASAIIKLIDYPEKRLELGRLARKRIVENFSQEFIALEYEKIYLRLIKE